MKGKISYYTCKSLNLTDLINGNIKIGKYSKIHHPAKLIGNISIGDYTYLGSYCSGIFDRGKSLKIGKFCSISSGVSFICGPDHDYEKLTTYPTSLLKINHAKTESIYIGNDVWIGKNAMIIKGVTIGTGAVIGAGAIVTKDIPPYAIAVGNPAKVKKYRFDAETIQKLLESERWNRDIEKIKKNYNLKFIIRD